MKDIEVYEMRRAQVLDSRARYVRVYDPFLRCENGSFVECKQGEKIEVGRILKQVGEQRFDVDLLGAILENGPVELSLLGLEWGVDDSVNMFTKLRWSEGLLSEDHEYELDGVIKTGLLPIDTLAPIVRGASHLVFYEEGRAFDPDGLIKNLLSHFQFPIGYSCQSNFPAFTNQDFHESKQSKMFLDDLPGEDSNLDIFSFFTRRADVVFVNTRYTPTFSKALEGFESDRNPTSTVLAFVKTPMDVFPIIESLNFGNTEAIWVINAEGVLDPGRTRTRILEGDSQRAKMMAAIHDYKEEKFEADLLGEPFEMELPYPELWEPTF